MNSLALKSDPRAEHIRCTEDELVVVLTDGRTLTVPLAWFPRLANATIRQRSKYELLGNGSGMHWPLVDEDISIAGLLTGNPSVEFRQSLTIRSNTTRRKRRAV